MSDTRSAAHLSETQIFPYLDVFLPGWNDAATPKSDFVANIHIINPGVWAYKDKRLSSVFRAREGLTPLLRLLAEAPNVHITADGNDEGEQYMAIFRCRNAWAELFRESAIEAVNYGIYEDGMSTFDRPRYHIYLKRGFIVPWMEYSERDARVVDHEGAVKFVEGLGFTEERCENRCAVLVIMRGDGHGWLGTMYLVFAGWRSLAGW
jgi:hypothetical protein